MITIMGILAVLISAYQDYRKTWENTLEKFDFWLILFFLGCDVATIGFTYLIVR